MRWKEIMFEGGSGGTLDNYGPMFTPLFPNGDLPPWVAAKIKEIRRIMVTKPRVIWALRWYRVWVLDSIKNDMDRDLFNKLFREAVRATGFEKTRSQVSPQYEAEFLMKKFQSFEHWSGVPSPELKNFQFGYGVPTAIVNRLTEIEKRWIETRDGLIELEPDDKKLIDFGNGWAWFLLSRGACPLEADAMGHCGNVPSERSGDRIISLRKHVAGDIWTPHLTFIRHRNGYLGEMKGRGNLKPTPRYHKMITALLDDPKINGIVGGGYMPENNFDLTHLSPDEQKRLKAHTPGFSTFNELMEAGKTKEAKEMLSTKLGDRADEILGFENDTTAIIGEYSSVERYISDEGWGYENTFEEIEKRFDETITSKAGKQINGDDIYNQFHADYYYQTFIKHWYRFVEYRVYEIEVKFSEELDGPVKVCLDVNVIETLAEPDNDENPIEDHEKLDKIDDYGNNGWSDVSSDYFEDEITEEIVHAFFENDKKDANRIIDELVTIIINRYVEDDQDYGFSRTQFHPDQHEFEFGGEDGARRKRQYR